MQLIRFDDTCVIKRNTKDKDEYDNLAQEVVYTGACYYQEGGYSNAQQMIVRSPIVFLPDVSTMVNANDVVEITTRLGRKMNGVVYMPREVEMPITRQRITRLELKQAR